MQKQDKKRFAQAFKVLREFVRKEWDTAVWEDAVVDIYKAMSSETEGREVQAAKHTSAAIRSHYRGKNGKKSWQSAEWSEVEFLHITSLAMFELSFTIAHRPEEKTREDVEAENEALREQLAAVGNEKK